MIKVLFRKFLAMFLHDSVNFIMTQILNLESMYVIQWAHERNSMR